MSETYSDCLTANWRYERDTTECRLVYECMHDCKFCKPAKSVFRLQQCSKEARVHQALYLNDGWSLPDSSHDVAPSGIHLAEGAALLGNLLHDLLRAEDGLQVEPLALSQIAKMPSVMIDVACSWRLITQMNRDL